MQGPSHLVISWFVADASGLDKPRDRRIVAWAGFSPDFDVVAYEWSWTIGDWPNIVILAACLIGTLAFGKWAGYSPVECFGDRADRWTIQVLQRGSVASSGRMRLAIWAAVLAAAVAILAPLGFNPFR